MALFKRRSMRKVKNKSKKPTIVLDKTIDHRVMLLAGAIVICFLILFIRLLYIQVFSYEDYTAKKDDYTSIKQYVSAPRGEIYDCKGRVLAKTVISHNIVYTSPNNMTIDDYKLYAERVVSVFDIDVDSFTERDKKEAYMTYLSLNDDPNALLTDKEQEEYESGAWGSDSESIRYGLMYDRIGDDELEEMDEDTLKMCIVYQRMTTNYSTGQENVILEDVSDSDVAYLVEHKTEFPGFDVDFGGWKREYPYGETLSDVLGTVTTSTEGLPEEYSDYYLQKGYQYNAPVGKSGLEYQYNDVLAGIAEESRITYDSNGLAKKEVIRQARKGNDIYLSIDIDLQQSLDTTLKTVLQENGGTERRENFYSLFMCMMDPYTGEVIALSGYQMDPDTRQMTYFASGNYMSLVNPGSSIKGATVYMGLSEGVIQPGEVINDEVMNIAGQEFGSYQDHGPVNDIQALSVSSNVYMFNIAIRLGGGTYQEGEPLNISNVSGTFDKMRSYYSMFGLGNITGLDVPGEVTGYMGVGREPGMLLNYSIGQFDMYTPIQLLEYVSTIATNGLIYQPKLMSYVMEVNSEEIVSVNESVLKNTLPEENSEYLSRVQQGFRACVADGNCGVLRDFSVPVAGKTGTAEVNEWTTAAFVGWAPYEDADVSFACVAPTSSINDQSVAPNICTTEVVPQVLQRYFELYPQ